MSKKIRVYTKTGDSGETSLASGTRVLKSHPRLEAYGSVDELNSHLGYLQCQIPDKTAAELILKAQHKVFIVSSTLASDEPQLSGKLPQIEDSDIAELEQDCDRMLDGLPPLMNFIIPGGHPLVASCHIARTVCRRAERNIIALNQTVSIPSNLIKYINRLSDYLFVVARKIASDLDVEELKWMSD